MSLNPPLPLFLTGCASPVSGTPDGGVADAAAPSDFAAPDIPDAAVEDLRAADISGADAYVVPQGKVTKGTDPNLFLIRGGIVVTADENENVRATRNGQVLFSRKDGKISCVGDGQRPCPGAEGATVIDVPSTYKVYPGLVDMHNHPNYNICPKFEHPGSAYTYNGDWRQDPRYRDIWKPEYFNPNDRARPCDMYRYGLIGGLIGGATSIQGIGTNFMCLSDAEGYPLLMRRVDSSLELRSPDHVATWAVLSLYGSGDAATVCGNIDAGKTDRVIVHCGEGRVDDPRTQAEFAYLKGLNGGCFFNPHQPASDGGVARPSRARALVIIHGNFTRQIFEEMKALGTEREGRPTIVWSVSSNTDLYGWDPKSTLDVVTAMGLGISVAIGPDWRPSNGSGMITEMNVAWRFSSEFFKGAVTKEDIFKMATIHAAYAAGTQGYVGRLASGYHADITVASGIADDPFEAAYLSNVAGVFVNGMLYYGDTWLMEASPIAHSNPDGGVANCEGIRVCGVDKNLCVPKTRDGEWVSYLSLAQETFVRDPARGKPDAGAPDGGLARLIVEPGGDPKYQNACRP